MPVDWIEASDQRKLGMIDEADWDNETTDAVNAIFRPIRLVPEL